MNVVKIQVFPYHCKWLRILYTQVPGSPLSTSENHAKQTNLHIQRALCLPHGSNYKLVQKR